MNQLFLAFNVVLAAAMVVSIVRFLWSGWAEPELRGPRLLAALSSILTLLAAGLIYAAEFARVLAAATNEWGTPAFHDGVVRDSDAVARFFTTLAEWVTFRPHLALDAHPPLWAAFFLIATYVLRLLIYLAAFRRRLTDANATGSVVWSHITAFGMAIGFALIVPHWPAWIVASVAGALLLLLATVLTGIFADAAALALGYTDFVVGTIVAFLQEIANTAVWIAGIVKASFKRAEAWYAEHVSARVRAHASRMTARSRRLRVNAKRRLEEQNRRQRARFRKEEVPPPVPDPPT